MEVLRKIGLFSFGFGAFVLMAILSVSSALAQRSNTYNCTWDFSSDTCVVDLATFDCVPGYEAPEGICSDFTQTSACLGAVNRECQLIESDDPDEPEQPDEPGEEPEIQRWSWFGSFGGCVLDDNGPFTSLEDCQASVEVGVSYRCDPEEGCVVDSEGGLSSIDCSQVCTDIGQDYDCGWGIIPPGNPHPGQPGFCVGGFSYQQTQNPDLNEQVCFGCSGHTSCGGVIDRVYRLFTHEAVQCKRLGDFDNLLWAESEDTPGEYYTCFTGEWSGEVESALQDVRNDRDILCTALGVTTLAGTFSGVGTFTVGVLGAGAATVVGCFTENNPSFNVYGEFYRAGATSPSCSQTMSLNYNFVVAGDNYWCQDGLSIDTAIGCVPVDFISNTVEFIVEWAIGVGGGVAVFLVITGGIMILTSMGREEKIKGGKELITGAAIGLALIVFSIFLVRFVGLDILQIPGFS